MLPMGTTSEKPLLLVMPLLFRRSGRQTFKTRTTQVRKLCLCAHGAFVPRLCLIIITVFAIIINCKNAVLHGLHQSSGRHVLCMI